MAPIAHALPQGAQVAAGNATFSNPNPSTLYVNQSSIKTIINWNKYGIATNEVVRYFQPGSNSIVLNRVTGVNPSLIYGQLSGNGQVWIINPNGLLIGPNAKVNVGGFLASTLNIADKDFLTGRYNFNGSSTPLSSIVNQGTIKSADGGYVALLSPSITNEGTITATLGKVQLASGAGITLSFADNDLIGLIIDEKSAAESLGVQNCGLINAQGGQITLSARSAGDALKTVVNNSGIIQARSIGEHNGIIRLEGGATGVVSVSGTLDASGRGTGERGGAILLLGDKIGLTGKASLDASGENGGGEILVGGNYKGQGTEQNASTVYIGRAATITADATNTGNGGRVILWSNDYTGFYGSISAKGATGGSGGFVETSSHNNLQAMGAVDASSPTGNAGMWLLDPRDVTITSSTSGGAFSGSSPEDVFTPTTDSATILNTTINNTLNAGTSVTITTGASGAQNGDITVAANISKTLGGDATLTLLAANSIIVNPGVLITSDSNKLNVVLNSDSDANGAGRIFLDTGSKISSNGGNITLGGGANPLTGYAVGTAQYGILLNNATLTSDAGNISIRGKGVGGTSNAYGIYVLAGSTIKSTSGNISLDGVGGNGTNSNLGILLSDATTTVQTLDGAISITGVGSGTGSGNSGMQIGSGAQVISTGAGSIAMNGTGAAGINANQGVVLSDFGKLVTSATGDISVVGLGGNGSGQSNAGIYAYNGGAITSSGSAAINLNGTGGSSSSNSYSIGVWLDTSSLLQSASGAITLNGTGGNATGSGTSQNHGVFINGAGTKITSQDGAIGITGAASGGDFRNRGIDVEAAAIASTGLAIIILNGTGAGVTDENAGVYLTGGASITSRANAAINITGQGAGSAPGISASGGINRIGWDGISVVPTGNITLAADTLAGNDSISLDNTSIRTTGNLFLQPLKAGTAIGLAGTGGDFNLSNSDLAALATGFNSIAIGRADGTGLISANALTFNDNLTLQNSGIGSAGMIFNGALNVGANNLTLKTTGSVTGNAPVTASTLNLLGGGGNYNLGNQNNDVTALTATTGTVKFRDDNGFIVSGITAVGDTTLSTTNTVTQTSAIRAAGLELLGSGGKYLLNDSGNAVAKLAADTGTISYSQDGSLAVDKVNSTGVSASNSALIRVTGATSDIILNNGITTGAAGDSLVLAAGRNFINKAGASPMNPGPGRFLVYSQNPANNNFGDFVSSGNAFGRSYAANPPGAADISSLSGSRMIYTVRPTITVTADPKTKTYGAANPVLTYTASGLVVGDTESSAFSGDLATTANAVSNVGSYPITKGDLAAQLGYTASSFTPGTLSITLPPLPPQPPINPTPIIVLVPTPTLISAATPVIELAPSLSPSTNLSPVITAGRDGTIHIGTSPSPVFGDSKAVSPGIGPPTITLKMSLTEEPVEILGSVDAFKILVNDSEPELPRGDIVLRNYLNNDVIDIKGNELATPLQFQVEVTSPEKIASHALVIATLNGETLYTRVGKGSPVKNISWNGRTDKNVALKSGALYQYGLEIKYKDGSRITSPFRLFGLNNQSGKVRTVVLDQHRELSTVMVNKSSVAIDALGRFSKIVSGKDGLIEIEIVDSQGRSIRTSLEMPKVTLEKPRLTIPPQGQTLDMNTSRSAAKMAFYEFSGQTSKNNSLTFNGKIVPVAADGTFSFSLKMEKGADTYWMHVRTPEGFGKLFRIVMLPDVNRDSNQIESIMPQTYLPELKLVKFVENRHLSL